jgi:hypothetical protein
VPIPEELYSALKHKVAANILLTLAYLEEATTQEGKAEKAAKAARALPEAAQSRATRSE